MRWSMDLRYNPIRQGSGRPAFPAFVARSARRPESALEDFEAWKAMWYDARETIVSGAYPDLIFEDVRWNDHTVC